jgi:hypothetical protein
VDCARLVGAETKLRARARDGEERNAIGWAYAPPDELFRSHSCALLVAWRDVLLIENQNVEMTAGKASFDETSAVTARIAASAYDLAGSVMRWNRTTGSSRPFS